MQQQMIQEYSTILSNIYPVYVSPFWTFPRLVLVIGLIGGMLAVGLYYWYFVRVITESFEQRVLRLLELLKEYCEKEDYKAFFTHGTILLKELLHRHYHWRWESKTDQELLEILKTNTTLHHVSITDKTRQAVEGFFAAASTYKFSQETAQEKKESMHALLASIVAYAHEVIQVSHTSSSSSQ